MHIWNYKFIEIDIGSVNFESSGLYYWYMPFMIHPIQVYPTYLGEYVLSCWVWINSISPSLFPVLLFTLPTLFRFAVLRFDWLRDEGWGNERRVSTWLLILRHGDLRDRALKSELLAQKSGAPCRMVSGRDVNGTQWVAEKNGIRKYPTNACIGVFSLFLSWGGRKKERKTASKRPHWLGSWRLFKGFGTIHFCAIHHYFELQRSTWLSNDIRL